MANLINWITKEANGEKIEAVVIGEMGWGEYNTESNPNYEKIKRGKVYTWEEATPLLNYEFNSGFGAPECNAFYAYTKNWIISVSQYDGSTSPFRIPRNPTEGIEPSMPGGG